MYRLLLVALLVGAQAAFGLSAVTKRKSYSDGQILTADDYNADRDEDVTWVNALNAKFPGSSPNDSVKTTLGVHDTLLSTGDGKIGIKNHLYSIDSGDSLVFDWAHLDTLLVGDTPLIIGYEFAMTAGSRAFISRLRADTVTADCLTVLGPTTFTAGSPLTASRLNPDSVYIGGTAVVGYATAQTAGTKNFTAYSKTDSTTTDCLTVTGPATVSGAFTQADGATLTSGRIHPDSVYIGGTAVIGYEMASTAGQRVLFSHANAETVTVGTGETIIGDDTDIKIASGESIDLTATTDVVIPANVGVTFGSGEKIEGDDTDLTLTSGGDIVVSATTNAVFTGVQSVLMTAGDLRFSAGTDGHVLTSDGNGAMALEAVAVSPITALNNATENELVTVGATTTELDAENNLKSDGNYLRIAADNSTGFQAGASQDLKMYHDGSHSYISNAVGNLSLVGTNFSAQHNIGGTYPFHWTGTATGNYYFYANPTLNAGVSKIAFYLTPNFAPNAASNDVGLAMHSTGSATNAGGYKGIDVLHNQSTATLATLYDVYIRQASNPGNITSHYGLYIEGFSGSTNHYSAYFAGGTNRFYSAHGIRIGTDSDTARIMNSSGGGGSTTLYIGNGSINVTSDIRAKQNVRDFTGSALDILRQSRLKEFEYDGTKIGDPDRTGPAGRGTYLGFAAQDMYVYAPWAVHTQGTEADSASFAEAMAGRESPDHPLMWNVEYDHLVPTVATAVVELEARVDSLATEGARKDSLIADLARRVGALEGR